MLRSPAWLAASSPEKPATVVRAASSEALWRLAALHIESGKDAEALLASIPEEELDRPAAAIRLARAEAKVGLLGAAVTRLDRARRLAPESKELRRTRDEILRAADVR